jgi:plastocyanin
VIRARALLLVAASALACGLGSASVRASGTHHEVLMRGNSFAPRALTITLGDTVVWKNADIVKHNALRPETFDTGELRAGETFSWVPSDTGEYRYRCTIHQRMRGTITVAVAP